MKRGIKPKPTRLKILAGNPGKRKLNEHEPAPPIRAPKCPAHLDADAKAEWRRVTKLLVGMGVLAEIDRTALAAYCQLYSRWLEAERQIKQHGFVLATKDKTAIYQSPYVGIANTAIREMYRLMGEFGMTPSSRTRLHAEPDKPEAGHAKYFETG